MKHIKLYEEFLNESMIHESYELYEKKYTSQERKELEKNGEAMPGGRFPIKDLTDLRNAIHYLGKNVAKDGADVAKFIAKRMKDLDGLKYTDMFSSALKNSKLGNEKQYLA